MAAHTRDVKNVWIVLKWAKNFFLLNSKGWKWWILSGNEKDCIKRNYNKSNTMVLVELS